MSAVEAVHHPLRLHIVAVRDWVIDFRSVHDLDARTIHTRPKAILKGNKKPFPGPESLKNMIFERIQAEIYRLISGEKNLLHLRARYNFLSKFAVKSGTLLSCFA